MKNLWAYILLDSIKAEILFSAIKDILNLALSNIRGQCYDGTAAMAGYKMGVATRLLQEQPKALYSHCYGHALNLAYGDMTKQIKVLKDALNTAFEMVRFIKYSSQREACFGHIKVGTRHTRGKSICPTCWTVRADALRGILESRQL